MSTTRVSILGATGYGGGELLRLLLQHPNVTVAHATSRSEGGRSVGQVHRNLDRLTDLTFSNPDLETLLADSDVVIGALPHGASAEVLAPIVERGMRVIDLSGDYRLRDMDTYAKWYKRTHPRPDLVPSAVYGCPEINAEAIADAKLVASPGCFATALNLSLLPAAAKGSLKGRVQATAMTASSGSGADAKAGTHHPTRAGTMRPYKVLSHQHTPEVTQTLRDQGGDVQAIDFTPVSAPLIRGILAIVTAEATLGDTDEAVVEAYRAFYADAPFIKVLSDREPECASIAGTNYVEVRPRLMEDGRLHVVTAIDNLVKGGAGQAVQSLNIMLGLPQTTGLSWLGTWP